MAPAPAPPPTEQPHPLTRSSSSSPFRFAAPSSTRAARKRSREYDAYRLVQSVDRDGGRESRERRAREVGDGFVGAGTGGGSESGARPGSGSGSGSETIRGGLDRSGRLDVDIDVKIGAGEAEDVVRMQFSKAPRFCASSLRDVTQREQVGEGKGKDGALYGRDGEIAGDGETAATQKTLVGGRDMWQTSAAKRRRTLQQISDASSPLPTSGEVEKPPAHDLSNDSHEPDTQAGLQDTDSSVHVITASKHNSPQRHRQFQQPNPSTPPKHRFLLPSSTTLNHNPSQANTTPPRRPSFLPPNSTSTSTSPISTIAGTTTGAGATTAATTTNTTTTPTKPKTQTQTHTPASLFLLSTAFSPHHRGSKHAPHARFVRGGWADCVRGWVVDVVAGAAGGGASAGDGGRNGAAEVVVVAQVSGGVDGGLNVAAPGDADLRVDAESSSDGLVLAAGFIEDRDGGRAGAVAAGNPLADLDPAAGGYALPVRLALVGLPSHSRKSKGGRGGLVDVDERAPQALRIGSRVCVNAPTWDVEVQGQLWRVGVDWGIEGVDSAIDEYKL